jgi:heavy metal translocating P-type ATPase
MHARAWSLIRANPVPLVALVGLITGGALTWLFGNALVGEWAWTAALIAGGAPLVWRTAGRVLKGHFASDVVATLAIVAAVAMDQPFAGLLVVLMQSGGEALDDYGFRRASSSLENLVARAPRSARRRSGEHLVDIAVEEVLVGDALVVSPGELIPVDGTLASAEAEIDESALTGEPLARPKARGAMLMSGSVNAGGAFEMQATSVSEESQYAKIVALVRQAQNDKAPIVRLADRYAVWFTPLTLLICGFGWAVTGDPRTILAVLVVATPCPLILAAPIAVISGINRAARAGIIVKGGTAIEQVGRAQAVVFDKTGTLTQGGPVVSEVLALDGVGPGELLRRAASVEQFSSHLLGQALVHGAKSRGLSLALPDQFEEVPGRGVTGLLDGQQVAVGSLAFLAPFLDAPGVSALERATAHRPAGCELSALIALDHEPAGIVLFSDEMRPGVPQLMERLRRLGVRHTVMLTGDRCENAQRVARDAGIDEVEAELLPEEKVLAVHRLRTSYEPLVMVGDGINDAPALAAATVGIAMGARGTGISAEAADIVLLVDDVTKVGLVIDIGQRTRRIVLQSIGTGIGVSLVLMVIASFGLIPAPVGALCQEALDVLVILNALRAR